MEWNEMVWMIENSEKIEWNGWCKQTGGWSLVDFNGHSFTSHYNQ